MPARTFGKYEVLARLATGGAAHIFLARQPGAAGFHKLVCLKTLLPERASDEDFVAMFLDEARLAARLNHPNCVQIYDLGRVKGVFYISMEYIFGDTLWNLLTTVTKLRTPLPPEHVASIIANACDGLHHAHELKDKGGKKYNLVHRDVSPQNIMITYEGQTKVVDFGIAKAETGRAPTVAGIVKGKFSYMSPEQITGGSVDRRSDIYSLGIVFFECLASRRLYRGESPEDIARLILEHRAPRLRDVVEEMPSELDAICAKALARHPSKRFQTAQEMGEALRDYLDGIRYNHSASVISKLMAERFGETIERRRKVFESALAGSDDESELLDALDARAVRNLDLFPEGDPATNGDGKSNPSLEDGDGESSSRRRGAGFQVSVEVSHVEAEQIEMITDGELSDGGASSEDLTRVDPSAIEENIAGPDERTAEHASDATSIDAESLEWVDATSTDDGVSDKTLDDEPKRPDHGVVVQAAAPGNNGAVVTRSKAPPTAKPKMQVSSGSGVVKDTNVTTPPQMPAPAVEIAPEPAPLAEVVSAPPPQSEPGHAVVEPMSHFPVSYERRFSLAAMFAAVGFGISFGLVMGLVLARLMF